MTIKIVSGAQTGVDRAALDVAIQLQMPYGGWIPKGRMSEDGGVPARYKYLQEIKSKSYKIRTEWNVRDSNATLIVCWGQPSGGTLNTKLHAIKLGKPYFIANLEAVTPPIYETITWLKSIKDLRTLNIAGPRKSKYPLRDIEGETRSFLRQVMFSCP